MPLSPRKVVEIATDDMKALIWFTIATATLICVGAFMAIWINPYRLSLLAQLFGVYEWTMSKTIIMGIMLAFAFAGILIFFQVAILTRTRRNLKIILPDVPEKATKSAPDKPTEGKKEIEVSQSVSE